MEVLRDLKKLYTINHNNEVVGFATNLKSFVAILNELEPNARNYDYYGREFGKKNIIEFKGETGKIYNLQKVFDR